MGKLSRATFEGRELPLRELAQQHKKLWAFNGVIGDYGTMFADIRRGSVVSLDVYNDTAWPHAMHLHGHHFWVMSDDPTADLPSGQRDTWLMQPQERASLVFVADNPGLWLFHCHMLEHAAAGMSAVLSID
jgi:FtsP/CotA-like multicopper oxidase with cupredoxin domain